MIIKIVFFKLLLVIYLLIGCSTGSNNLRTKTENNWLLLQNVGYQIESGNVIWTAGGIFKVDSISEIEVNNVISSSKRERLFIYKGNIPAKFYLAKSKPLKGKELDFLKDTKDTKMFIEVILKDKIGNIEKLYTPVFYSSASKNTIRLILDSQNPNWRKE